MPLAVETLALADRLEPERAPVDAAQDTELARGEGVGGEGEEDLVEEGEEEGVEVVARGGEAAVFLSFFGFFACFQGEFFSFFFFFVFPLLLFSLSKNSKSFSYRSSTAASPSRGVM